MRQSKKPATPALLKSSTAWEERAPLDCRDDSEETKLAVQVVRMSQEEMAALKDAARFVRRSQNQFARDAIAAHVKHVEQLSASAKYGYCPVCGAACRTRERRLNGHDVCVNGHSYLSRTALEWKQARKLLPIYLGGTCDL